MKLSEAVKLLTDAGVPDASCDARLLFSDIGGVSRASLYREDVSIDSPELEAAVEKRAARVPLQYILGKAYFYDEEYTVNESCLIPRQDTEVLVEYAVKNIPRGENFIDLCTGSGCIGISTLKHTCDTVATLADISPEAIALAKLNAENMGVIDRAKIITCDLLSYEPQEKFYAVLSNPPYVKDEVYETLEREIFFEPRIAFVGGTDGCNFYRSFTKKYKDHLKEGGFIAYEIGFDQGEAIREIADECGMSCSVIKV